MNRKRLKKGVLLVVLIAATVFASFFEAMQVSQLPGNYNLAINARPLLNYTSMEFQEVSMVRDLWNESFEVSLNSENHYLWSTISQKINKAFMKGKSRPHV